MNGTVLERTRIIYINIYLFKCNENNSYDALLHKMHYPKVLENSRSAIYVYCRCGFRHLVL